MLRDLVDLDAYPLDQPDHPRLRATVAHARAELAEDGCCRLAGLIRPNALDRIRRDTAALEDQAVVTGAEVTCYGLETDQTAPAGDPRGIALKRTNAFVAGDRIGPDMAIREIFHDAGFQGFIARCIDAREIHEFADPLAQLVINVLKDGLGHNWHFDSNEFTVSLLTQEAESGGEFEYCPQIRTPNNENFEGIGKVLAGDRGPVKQLNLRPGDLQIFFGRYSLHRVVPVAGARARHTVIFAYAREAGMMGDPVKTRRIFGRSTDRHTPGGAGFDRTDGLVG